MLLSMFFKSLLSKDKPHARTMWTDLISIHLRIPACYFNSVTFLVLINDLAVFNVKMFVRTGRRSHFSICDFTENKRLKINGILLLEMEREESYKRTDTFLPQSNAYYTYLHFWLYLTSLETGERWKHNYAIIWKLCFWTNLGSVFKQEKDILL